MTYEISRNALAKAQEDTACQTCMAMTREVHDAVVADAVRTYLAAAAPITKENNGGLGRGVGVTAVAGGGGEGRLEVVYGSASGSVVFGGGGGATRIPSTHEQSMAIDVNALKAEVKRLSDREAAFGERVDCPVGRFRLEWAEEHIKDLRRDALATGTELTRLRRLLERGMALANGLMCLGCGGWPRQGRALSLGCCRDADCDAGFFGIEADEVKAFLEAADEAVPGALEKLEAEPKLPKADDGIEGADRI
jgi:hypothetical protein